MNAGFATQAGLRSLVTTLFSATVLMARGVVSPLDPGFTVQSWDSADGLPGAPIHALARSPDGYLWLGTSAGLVRFDGARFVTLTTNTTPALGDHRIASLLADTNGVLWIGSQGGTLARRQAATFFQVPLDPRLRGVPINTLKPALGGGLWLGTSGRGLVRFKDGACDFATPTNGLRRAEVTSVVREEPGRLWVVSRARLMTLAQDRWQIAPSGPDETTPTYAVAAGLGDCAWLATASENVLRDRGGRVFQFTSRAAFRELAPYPWSQDSQRASIRSILEDQAGRVWVGTVGDGAFYWTPGTGWQRLASDGSLAGTMVPVMLEDADGLLWMAGSQGTLHRARERRVASLRVNAVEEGLTVSSVCIGRDGIVWIGTDDAGVFRFANNALTQITNGLANLHIHSVFVDRRTNVWVGTLNGLYRWRDTRFARYALPVSSTPVSALFEDRRGNVWAGTGKGLVRIRPDGAATLFAEAAGLDHFFFRSLAEDAQGRLCVAMGDRGLYRMAGERFELFGSDRWSGAELIRGLHAEADGGLWLTTSGAGLFRFQDGVFRQWTKADGLPEMTLNGIVEDERNNLWFSSENGIFGCPKAALLAERGGRSGPLLFWHLSVADGMDTKACSGSGQPVVARSADGHFWVPNRRALAVFDPAEVTRFGNMWTPFVEGVVADGVPVRTDGDGVLRLRSGARRVEFHYTCPDLHSPERLRFRYRLEDSDADWTDAGAQRVAYYGQLPPGVYRFRVLAGGAAGEWREAAAVLPLTIVPQWWERTALRVTGGFSGALLLGGTVWLLARARGRRKLARLQLQHARESERRRIARDIHDDLGATLTRVALLGDMSSSPEEAQSHLHKISAAARDMSQSLEAIVWAVRPENDTLRSLADYLERRADEIFEGAPATCRFVAPREFPERLVFAEARHNVFLACKEALTNALKHAPTAEVRVELVCTGDECLITVADNGPGFDPESARAGAAGLKNMRWRMEEIGGRFELHSQRGKGTTVRLGFPVLRPSAS